MNFFYWTLRKIIFFLAKRILFICNIYNNISKRKLLTRKIYYCDVMKENGRNSIDRRNESQKKKKKEK